MKKVLVTIFHVLALLVFVASVSALYSDAVGEKGIAWISVESYEDSPQFAKSFSEDISEIKKLAVYTEAFAYDGSLNEDSVVAEITDPENNGYYTIEDIKTMAAGFGIYFDEETNKVMTDGQVSDVDPDESIRVNRKTYDPYYVDNLEPGPSQGIMNKKDLCMEVLKCVAEYRSLKAKYIDGSSNFSFYICYPCVSGEYMTITNTTLGADQIEKLGKGVRYSAEYGLTDCSVDPYPSAVEFVPSSEYEESEFPEYDISAGVDTTYPYVDRYSQAAASYNGKITAAYEWIAAALISLPVIAVTLVIILSEASSEGLSEESGRHQFDRLPIEVFSVLCAAFAVIFYFAFKATLCPVIDNLAPMAQQQYWRTVAKYLISYGMIIIILRSAIRRYRKGTLYKESMFSKLELSLEDYLENGRLSATLFVKFAGFVLMNVLGVGFAMYFYYQGLNGISSRGILTAAVIAAALIVADALCYNLLFRDALQRDNIRDALKDVSEGEVESELDEKKFSGKNLEMAESINHISEGLTTAVRDQVKSERLKADLITNVSHDIKTPLTSIINYIGLLKMENIHSDSAKEYLDILEKKSERLKNLTEDLVEASKASSGNIRIEPAKLDIAELTEQAAAEFTDKFSARGLEFIFDAPEEPVFVLADGRHLWRIFENLFNNAAKYSMESTRVYGSVSTGKVSETGLSDEKTFVTFTIKNISEMKLNISPDELTERFVRGDLSRTTEGSGLGLSIAKRLASLMGGKLKIEIDGDLYKANVILPLYEESGAAEEK